MRHEAKPEAIRERLHLGHWIISRPVPRSTTTCVLSIITRSGAPFI
jgi:IS30 family transposase